MKIKPCVLYIISGLLLVTLVGKATANGIPIGDEIESSKNLVSRFYRDWQSGNKMKIKQHFVNIPEEELKYLIATRKDKKIIKLEYIESSVISRQPLVVNIVVKEWYNIKEIPPYMEYLFIVKKMKGNFWKIVDITEPGLP